MESEVQSAYLCEECGSPLRVVDGENVCTSCGLVHDALLVGPILQDRHYSREPHNILGSEISPRPKDASGAQLTSSRVYVQKRLLRTQQRKSNDLQRSTDTLARLGHYSGTLCLPNSAYLRAVMILRTVLRDWTRGSHIFLESFVLASILYAAREHGFPLTIRQLVLQWDKNPVHHNRIAKGQVKRAYLVLQSKFGNRPGINAESFLPKLIGVLALGPQVEQAARQLLEKYSQTDHNSHGAHTLAAGAIWLVVKGRRFEGRWVKWNDMIRSTGINWTVLSEAVHSLRKCLTESQIAEVTAVLDESRPSRDPPEKCTQKDGPEKRVSTLKRDREIYRLLSEDGLTIGEVSEKTGLAESTVYKIRLAFRKTTEAVRGLLMSGRISTESACRLAGLPPEEQTRIAGIIENRHMTVREVESEAHRVRLGRIYQRLNPAPLVD